MVTNKRISMQPEGNNLFDRVVSILEQARSKAVRAVCPGGSQKLKQLGCPHTGQAKCECANIISLPI